MGQPQLSSVAPFGVVLKTTNVDGVYDDDPRHNPSACLLENLTYHKMTSKDFSVMTAITLCQENNVPDLRPTCSYANSCFFGSISIEDKSMPGSNIKHHLNLPAEPWIISNGFVKAPDNMGHELGVSRVGSYAWLSIMLYFQRLLKVAGIYCLFTKASLDLDLKCSSIAS
ncbi:hypothetical protein NC652_019560 [Populus alba x Populus x berolinensis]|nr:hypothetical protein NC652_019560 [Populus alba x Populus x berolinensis]